MDLRRTSTKVALAFGILVVIGVVARIAGAFLGLDSYVGRDLVIFGPAVAIIGVLGATVSLLIGYVKSNANSRPTTPPGWYPDPQDANLVRYFDGTTWTQQTAPRPPGP